MDDYQLLESLFGAKRAEGGTAHMETATMVGVAVEDSEDGQVKIIPDGKVAAAAGDDNIVIVPTSPNVQEGDTVLISMTGGVSKSPMVIGAKGAGDRVKADIEDFKTYAEVEYTHESTFDTVTGAISNTITANYSATAPNISPFFSFDEPAADSITNDYWARYAANPSANTRNTSATVTPLSDGWLHIVKTAGTSNVIFAPKAQPSISANGKYTLLFEFKNVTVSGTNRMQIANVNYGQLCATGTSYYFQVAEGTQRFVFPSDGLEIRSTNSELARFSLNSALVVTCDMRVSLYEGEYMGGYKPYGLSKADAVKEYATRSYVSQTADAIELEVSQTAAIANTAGNPNLEPFFSVDVGDTDYWASIGAPFSNLGDGWTRYYRNQKAGAQYFYARPAAKSWVKAGGTYTLLVEIANSNAAAQGRPLSFLATDAQLSGSAISSLADGVYRIPLTVKTLSNPYLVNIRYHQNARVEAQFDMRVSLYEGDYKGVFKPYVEDVGGIADTYATKSALTIATDSISSLVQGNATYTDPVSGQTVTSALGTQVTQSASDVSTLLTDVGGIQTMIREATDGILVAKTGNTVGALVNADGSFDVVELSWSGDTPTITGTLSTFGTTAIIGDTGGLHAILDSDSFDIADGAASAFNVSYEERVPGYRYPNLRLSMLHNDSVDYDIMGVNFSGEVELNRPPVIGRLGGGHFTSLETVYPGYQGASFTIVEAHYTGNACSVTIPIQFQSGVAISTTASLVLAGMNGYTSGSIVGPAPPYYTKRAPVLLANANGTAIGLAELSHSGAIGINSFGFAWTSAIGEISYTCNLADWA